MLTWSPRADLRGRPVLIINAGKHDPANREASLAALLTVLDGAIAASATAELTVVFDVRDYGLANADLKTARRMVGALQRGYPENLGLACFLGAPRVFGMLWRAVRVLIDARTVSKVHFVQQPAELDALVGLFAVPEAQGGRNVGVQAHMERWCAELLAAEQRPAAGEQHAGCVARQAARRRPYLSALAPCATTQQPADATAPACAPRPPHVRAVAMQYAAADACGVCGGDSSRHAAYLLLTQYLIYY
jgi:hypothetical protein